MKRQVLYISYDGILEPLGRSQVLSYLENLSDEFSINLLTFEKKEDLQNTSELTLLEEVCRESNILWKRKTYHKKPILLATLWDVVVGICFVAFNLVKYDIKILHVRSDIPGLIALPFIKFFNKRLIFDMRGFWADEKADRAGWSREGLKYKFFKKLEVNLINLSDSVVSLTDEAICLLEDNSEVKKGVNFKTIRTCVDRDIFKPIVSNNKDSNKLVFGHLGSVDTAYDIEPVLSLFKEFLEDMPEVEIHFFNKKNHKYIIKECEALKVPQENVMIKSLGRQELSDHLSKISIGCFFANDNFSIKASLPTKIGEFLSCGKPILCNDINADVKEIVEKNRVGIVCDLKDSSARKKAKADLMKLIQDKDLKYRCINLAENSFSLDKGIRQYKDIYEGLLSETNHL